MSPALIATLAGVLIPLFFLWFVWHKNDLLIYVALIMVTTFLGAIGMGELLPLFGHTVVGGSFYFPTSLTILVIISARYSIIISRKVLTACMCALLFVTLGYARWYIFGLYGTEFTTHKTHENIIVARNSAIMLCMYFFAGTVILSCQRALSPFPLMTRLSIPLFTDLIITTPFSIGAAYIVHYVNPAIDWVDVTLWTFICRFIVPLSFLGYLAIRRYKDPPQNEQQTSFYRENCSSLSSAGREQNGGR